MKRTVLGHFVTVTGRESSSFDHACTEGGEGECTSEVAMRNMYNSK
jgi:hypothetical protein